MRSRVVGTRYPVQVANLSTDVSVLCLFRSGDTRSRSFLRCVLPWSGFPLLRPLGCTPAEAQSLRLFAAVAAAAVCLVVSGHSSTLTCSN